jgi:RNA polymerase sigma-70 factor (ECF subfamily)
MPILKICPWHPRFVPTLKENFSGESEAIFCYRTSNTNSSFRGPFRVAKSADENHHADEDCNLNFDELRALSDEQLMAHTRRGNGDALGILFDRYHRLVLHVALKILRDVGEAEDVLQSVFMEIYKLAVQFDPARGTAKMWILRYAYHRSINRRRQLLVRNFYATTDLAGIENALPAPGSDIVASHEARDVIEQGLLKLNQVQRRVLELAYFESLTMKEIAEQYSTSLLSGPRQAA